ncbi:ComEC/Rec2 family competence protein [Flavobacterium granuli]|uniref:Competence protein ComEC n=1 Tax=Flavobacterium granuli TaxID=280093 RepID=A0A1M5PKA1_9FLAO|nr:ComEC/Rec2 family competence protein [Flavobacterium granuli]PRZ26521.1 competence protein ComEC [Flavobacterium granuli]SHH02246.1 competence protein ComEC [Flavobacterium granuli]
MKVLQFPLARITVGFILGILAVFYLKPNPIFVFGLLFIAFLFFIISYFLQKKTFDKTIYFGIATYFVSFFIGAATQITQTDAYQKNHYTHNNVAFHKPQTVSITIREKLKNSNFNDRYIALINQINDEKYTGRIILNIPKDSLNLPLEVGTTLRIKGILYKNKSPNNPNQFDYGAYLENKQIYAQLYSDREKLEIGLIPIKDIWYYTSKLRTNIIHNLEKSGFSKTELSVAIALIMGQRQDISPEINQDYQYAGAIHILSVSGLHIGFIFLFVSFLLKPVPNTKKGAFLKLLIILLSLSSFAIIAGLAPSVVRSVTMFSFVAIGYSLRRTVNIYHTLLVSILLILLFQPSFLFDVGFQLSYIALFFIIWFQPLLSAIWKPKPKALNYFWEILTVSFAAQLGTLPLSIYYFHQFPGLFFVTNLAIIPLLNFIMILGIVVMILASLGYVPLLFAKPFEYSIYCLNKIVNFIASFEQFIIKDIPLNIYLLISFYLAIIAIIIYFKNPNFKKLIIALMAIIGIQLAFMTTQWNIKKQQEWLVFNLKKNTLITERHGNNVIVYANDSILKNSSETNILQSYLVANFSSVNVKEKLKNVLYYKGTKILVIDSFAVYPKNVNPDVLLLTQSPKINLERMLETLRPKIVIADASNQKTIQNYWKASCEKQKIPFHATAEKGFYILN